MNCVRSQYHVPCITVFLYQNTYFIVSPLIEVSFDKILQNAKKRNQKLSQEFIGYTLFCLANGILDLHKNYAIHRNINPKFLLVDHEKALLTNMTDTAFLV